jgi:hypothetical protein
VLPNTLPVFGSWRGGSGVPRSGTTANEQTCLDDASFDSEPMRAADRCSYRGRGGAAKVGQKTKTLSEMRSGRGLSELALSFGGD